MSVRAALALGLAIVAIAIAIVMSGSPPRVVGTSAAAMRTRVALLHGRDSACQGGEVIPRGTSAVRVGLEAVVGPSVTVTVLTAGHALTRGARGSGWTGADVTVPVARVRRTASDASVCLALGASREAIAMIGQLDRLPATTTSAGEAPSGQMRIEYLAAGDRSWWSQAGSVAQRIGLGRAPSGTWVALLVLALMAAVATLASLLCLRTLGAHGRGRARRWRPPGPLAGPLRGLGRVPTAAWVCALVACLNAASWSLLSPPFQTPDEPSHFAYVQQLVEAGRLPTGSNDDFSPEEQLALAALRHYYIAFLPSAKTISSRAQEHKLNEVLARPLSRSGPGDAGTAADEPPLYYALETVPYELGSGGTLLGQLELMRLLSALFGGLTALFAFLFVRETLPGTPWAWTVGGLGVALAPLLGFMSGAVNPDAMLCAVCAALYYLIARAFRRGLTPRLAAAIGTAIAVGILTKLNFLGLVPGAIAGLIVVALRAPRTTRSAVYAPLAIALGLAASPALLRIAFEPLVNGASLSLVSNSASEALQTRSLPAELSYIWQLYLPRLPGMTDYFPGIFTARQLWFDGFVGLYGWADTAFPGWVYDLALIPAGLLGALALRTLIAGRDALRSRVAELLVYAAMGVGVLALVGAFSYSNDVVSNQGPFSEPRYLLPMIILFGALLALAARGAGRRWGPAIGALIVVLILGHDIFSQLQVIARYYG
jgi:hypothetical protein